MRRYRTIAPYLLPLVCVAALLCVAAQKKESGDEPYAPTKLEWLAMRINALFRQAFQDADSYALDAREVHPNTLLLTAYVGPTCERTTVNKPLEKLREVTEAIAKSYGWDDWLIIREKVVVLHGSDKASADQAPR
jgi:hypothetical protein